MADNPFKTDAETAILSIILKNPADTFELENLRFYMFDSLVNQTLFKTIEEFREKSVTPDPALILSSLEASGSLNKVGGKEYINFLLSKEYDKSTLPEFLATAIQYYKSRTLLSLMSTINPSTLVPSDIDATLQDVRKTLDDLGSTSGGSTTIQIGEGLKGVYEELMSRRENPGLRGSSWGIKEIDEASAGKVSGELWYVGGRPAQGKTALICNSILKDAFNGVPVLIFEKEMSYQSLVERMLSIHTGIPITNIRQGILNQTQVNTIYETLNLFKSLPIHIDVSYFMADPSYVESTIQKYKRLYDIKVVYMDYIQLFSERDEGQTAELGRISRMLKLLCNKLDICAVIVSQLNRQVEMRENKRPILSDLRQSGNLEEDADFVVGLYRDEYYNKETQHKNLMEFIILKARSAAVGTVTVKFDSTTNKIGEA